MHRLFSSTAWLALLAIGFSNSFVNADDAQTFEFRDNERVAFVGGSLAERMNLFGHFESLLQSNFGEKKLLIRNFGWPADEVGKQQRPNDYTKIDNPLEVFSPELFICYFGFNEHFAGSSDKDVAKFVKDYKSWMETHRKKFSKDGRPVRFVLVSPIPFEKTSDELLPVAKNNNDNLKPYVSAIEKLAKEMKLPYVDLFNTQIEKFTENGDLDLTINGVHLNEAGDELIAESMAAQLFSQNPLKRNDKFEQLRTTVNDKSWLHLQDYRMLNGWYVYGRRRTWDKETFPGEFKKIREMVSVRDQYIWDLATGKEVPESPDDSKTGEVFIPGTMFGTCLLYTSPSPRDQRGSRMPSSA